MISSDKIASYIANPEILGYADIVHLDEIISKFPYCSTLHLLKLKAASSSNSLSFESDLRYGAIHVSDREKMYYLLHSNATAVSSKAVIANEEVIQTVEVNKHQEEIKAAQVKEEVKVVDPADDIKKETKHADIEKELIADPKKNESAVAQKQTQIDEKHEKIVLKKESAETVKNEIDKTIFPHLIESALENDLKSSAAKLDEPKKTVVKIEEKIEEKEVTPKKAEAVDLSKLSFVEWLKYKQTIKVNGPESSDLKVEKGIAPQQKTKVSKSHIDDLLSKFISEEPSISRPKVEFFNPVKNAKKSLEESDDLVTETLAKIYFLQKNYTKAIHAYEQLILVYPEKKTFFASQIEKIIDEQNK